MAIFFSASSRFTLLFRRTALHSWLAIVFLAILLATYGVLVASKPLVLTNDSEGYDIIARSLLAGSGFTDLRNPELVSYREPFYPLFLAGVYAIFGHDPRWVYAIQSILMIATLLWSAAAIEKRWGSGWAAAVSTGILLMPGVALQTAGAVLTEPLAMVLLLAAFLVTERNMRSPMRWAITGLLLGLLALTKYAFIFLPLLCVAGIILYRKKLDIEHPVRCAVLLLIGFMLPLVIWTFRNYKVGGYISPIGARAGAMDMLVRADKALYSPRELPAYLLGSVAGDHIARLVFPGYEEVIEPRESGIAVRALYYRYVEAGGYDAANVFATARVAAIAISHPVAYAVTAIAELLKFNSPMLWYNAADMRHLFAGTHPEYPDWFKVLAILLYRAPFFFMAAVAFVVAVLALFRYPALMFPALAILYANGIYVFFDVVSRHAMPIYPFVVFLFVWAVRSRIIGERT